jgi:HD-GYP domain-containing protein (c-di-GMP phosphodiesterase class II)
MRKVGLGFLKGEEMLARSIFDGEGRVLLRQGVILKAAFIKRLQALGVTSVYIDDEISRGIEITDIVSEETRQESKRVIADTMQKFIRNEKMSLQGIVTSAQRVIDDVLAQKEVMMNLVDIRAKEDVIFSHSVNVCILAVMTGVKMGYNLAKLKELAMGALMHDIGVLQIMKETVPGTGKLEMDMSRYREHPKLGYDFLNKQAVGAFLKVIALTHHEQYGGAGFPLGLQGDEIHEMVRIVSICDVFDHIVHDENNIYNVPSCQAIEYLEASTELFDGRIVQKFVTNVSLYPEGGRIRLSNGEMGIVIRQNRGYSSRPVVRTLGDNGKEINLSQNLTLFIEDVYAD